MFLVISSRYLSIRKYLKKLLILSKYVIFLSLIDELKENGDYKGKNK